MDYKKIYKNVEKRYVIVAIILVLLLTFKQIVFQFEINHGEDMSRVINISGRQRMMSQKITKDILMIYENDNVDAKEYYRDDLKSSLDILETSHYNLIKGCKEEGLRGTNSDTIISMFNEIDPYFNNILDSGYRVLAIMEENNYNEDLIFEEIKLISKNEKVFLQKMNEIVDQYDQEFKNTVSLIEGTEIFLYFIILFVFGILTLFIFRPATKTLRYALIDINERNENISKLFYAMKGALFLVNKNGDIMTMNSDARGIMKEDSKGDEKDNILTDIIWKDLNMAHLIEKVIVEEKLDGIEVKVENKIGDVMSVIISAISGKYKREDVIFISAFDITAQKNAEEMLKDLAIKDELTGLYNRHFLESIIDLEIKRSKRYEFPLSAAILDIDDFKKINDKYGHPVGDLILKEIANTLNANLRESDYLIRIGGEEFVIIMSHTGLEDAYIVAEKLRRSIADIQHPIIGRFTVSFGVAEIKNSESYPELYERMDKALYEAKQSGKNRVVKSTTEDDNDWDKLLLWKDSWNSGEDKIDQQHKELLEVAGRIIYGSRDLDNREGLLDDFNLILKLVKEHFDYEEKVLEKLKYINLKEHQNIHKDLLERVSTLKDKAVNGEIVFKDVFEFMFHNLILGHLIKEDVKFFPIIEASKNKI